MIIYNIHQDDNYATRLIYRFDSGDELIIIEPDYTPSMGERLIFTVRNLDADEMFPVSFMIQNITMSYNEFGDLDIHVILAHLHVIENFRYELVIRSRRSDEQS